MEGARHGMYRHALAERLSQGFPSTVLVCRDSSERMRGPKTATVCGVTAIEHFPLAQGVLGSAAA